MKISPTAARALLLNAQGLGIPPLSASKHDVLAAIRRMGALQIDTISVVARSHLFVLWSRVGAFDPGWLDELLKEGALFEYWSHAACFLPIDDFALYRPAMLAYRAKSMEMGWLKQHAAVAERVMEHLRRKGSARAADFERKDGHAGAWWDHKPEKQALEALFYSGIALIARRESFQRVYALQEEVLPGWSDLHLPNADEIEDEFAVRAVRALGVTPARWVADYYRRPKRGIAARLEALATAGRLLRAELPELGSEPAYLHPDMRETALAAEDGLLTPEFTALLSPFDPIVWDRQRAEELFGFQYRIEVYTPAAQRKFGYFTLPILHHGALVGRLCPKAHRKTGVFEIRQLHLEPGVSITEELVEELAGTIQACANWHGTPTVIIRQSEPPTFGDAVANSLRRRS